MNAFGKTIRIYLSDGTPTGIRHVELVNWTGQALMCPRGRLGELGDWAESQRPGVYFLVGEDESESRPALYIGEAENVLVRLQSQLSSKDFWNRTVFFTSKDENLTKVHVKYLESRLIQLAKQANRARLLNGNAPQLPALPRSDRDAMEEFLEPVRILLGSLGYPFLQPVSAGSGGGISSGSGIVGRRLRFSPAKRVINAEGAVTDEGFVVFAGAIGDAKTRAHLGKAYREQRAELLAEGIAVLDGDTIRLVADVLFTSPSAAAAVLAGGAYNGREAWKDASGATLKDLEEALATATVGAIKGA